ncbi:MAG: GtrA family protein [Deltaproteobacteria bacterium]|uniref:GtrA family protein n=1 Tax=Candidatus Desulfacyla euxinica TaxID=2841693 RepID=A0A8J6N0X1_9DELT|nr:GtrA family protein [Candidatus Desulfacyla euxinica]
MAMIPNRFYGLFERLFFQRSLFFFLITGALTAGVYFSIFAIMWNLLHINYKISLTAAYWGGLCFHFFMNRHVTFRSYCNIGRQVTKYLIMSFVNYVIALVVTVMVVNSLHFSPYVGVILSVCITVMSGYLMSRFWVFRHVE